MIQKLGISVLFALVLLSSACDESEEEAIEIPDVRNIQTNIEYEIESFPLGVTEKAILEWEVSSNQATQSFNCSKKCLTDEECREKFNNCLLPNAGDEFVPTETLCVKDSQNVRLTLREYTKNKSGDLLCVWFKRVDYQNEQIGQFSDNQKTFCRNTLQQEINTLKKEGYECIEQI